MKEKLKSILEVLCFKHKDRIVSENLLLEYFKKYIQDKDSYLILKKLIENKQLIKLWKTWMYYIVLKWDHIFNILDKYLYWYHYYFWWLYLFNKKHITKQIPNLFEVYTDKKMKKNTHFFWKDIEFHRINKKWFFEWIFKYQWPSQTTNILTNERLIIEIFINSNHKLYFHEIEKFLSSITFNKKKLLWLWKKMWLNIYRRVLLFLKLRWYDTKKYEKKIQKFSFWKIKFILWTNWYWQESYDSSLKIDFLNFNLKK